MDKERIKRFDSRLSDSSMLHVTPWGKKYVIHLDDPPTENEWKERMINIVIDVIFRRSQNSEGTEELFFDRRETVEGNYRIARILQKTREKEGGKFVTRYKLQYANYPNPKEDVRQRPNKMLGCKTMMKEFNQKLKRITKRKF